VYRSGLSYPRVARHSEGGRAWNVEAYSHILPLLEGSARTLRTSRPLLAVLLRALEASGEFDAASDVQQLQGLCERIDAEAFLPLDSRDLTSDLGTRILQYCRLVDAVAVALGREGLVSVFPNPGGSRPNYSRSITLPGYGLGLFFSATYWDRFGGTPLWLTVKGVVADRGWVFSQESRDALITLENDEPPRMFVIKDECVVPLRLPVGVERDAVVENVVGQVRCVVELLTAHKQRLGSTAGAASAEQMVSPSTPVSSTTGNQVDEE
jgi:hypothetical protein